MTMNEKDKQAFRNWLYSKQGEQLSIESGFLAGAEYARNKQAEPVASYQQVYKCKIKSKEKIAREIPREKQGWWADVAGGGLIRLRQANQADIDRCILNDAHSKNPNDYMCETFKNGALVAKIALEYMNPDENIFAQVHTHPTPAVAQPPVEALDEPLTDERKLEIIKNSELWDMHIHMGWYSVPSKSFAEKAFKLIDDIQAALKSAKEHGL